LLIVGGVWLQENCRYEHDLPQLSFFHP